MKPDPKGVVPSPSGVVDEPTAGMVPSHWHPNAGLVCTINGVCEWEAKRLLQLYYTSLKGSQDPTSPDSKADPALYRRAFIHYPKKPMWNVEERFAPKAIEGMAALGFAVGSTRGVVRVEKYGCGAEFRKGTDGLYQMTVSPTIMLKGQFTRLWDAGYQKFLLTDDGLKLPALAYHLENLRKFNEELRTTLGVPTFYNEALGSVSQISVYDRVKGRKGAVPDDTVGAHSDGGGH